MVFLSSSEVMEGLKESNLLANICMGLRIPGMIIAKITTAISMFDHGFLKSLIPAEISRKVKKFLPIHLAVKSLFLNAVKLFVNGIQFLFEVFY